MGQVCRITDQEGNDEYFYYDEEGRRETHIDRNGNVEYTLYNMDGSLCYQRFEDRKGRNPVVNRYAYYPDGKLKEAAGGGIAYQYAYTENGLLKSKSASGRPLFKYAYDSNRNLTSLTDGGGNIIHYSYDVMNRLKKVAGGRDEVLAAYDYDGVGQIRRLRYGNGVQTEYSYQDDGDIASLVTVTEQGQVLLNFDYAYDGNGNCVRKSGETYQNEYAYDRMNRLVSSVQDGQEERYVYDLVGNRLKKESVQGTESYHYNVKNQLTHIHNGENTLRYLYDKQGNLLKEQGQTRRKQYSYDTANRQVSIASSKEGGTIGKLLQFNRYDGEGLRYETEENGKIIRFLFDRGELAQENREGEETRYVRGRNPIALSRGGKDRNYFVQDEMGSTLFLLDQNHEIRKTYRYDAFGNLLEETGDIANRLMYTGQMYDGAAVQYYLRARFYNPAIGRFMQEDTYRGDGLNLYAYCANNPVIYYDPSGCWKLCPDGKYEPTGTDQDKIRAYRDLDIEKLREMFHETDPDKLLELFLADPEFIVDMPYVGQGMKNANSQGWKRDAKYFFRELSNAHPELFSNDNLQRIAKGDLPKVDDQFLEYFPQYKDYAGQLLVHHHIGGGGQAMPIPVELHEGFGVIHNIEKLLGIWGRVDGTVFSGMLQNIKSVTARTKNWINVRIK